MKINNSKYPMRKKVLTECAYIMSLPVCLQTIVEILAGLLGILTANTLGSFADAVFQLDISIGSHAAIRLLFCILATVFLSPAIGMFSDYIMFKKSLRHDKAVFCRYLKKCAEIAMDSDNGKTQYELEDAPCQLRIQWVVLLSKTISLPICLGYLLFCAGSISWTMTILLLALTAIQLITPLALRSIIATCDKKEKAYQATRRSYESDITVNPYILKLWNLQDAMLDRLRNHFMNYYNKEKVRYIRYQVLNDQLRLFINEFTRIVLFIVGAFMVANRIISAGDFAVMLTYLAVAHSLLSNAGDIIQNYPLLKNALDRVCWIYENEECADGITLQEVTRMDGIELSFSHSEKEVFRNVSFSIADGDKVCIVGENGSGKTTLCKIIVSLINSYTGNLKINNFNANEISQDSIRKNIVYAAQRPHLFHATVKNNILMGDENVSEETIEEIMRELGILHLSNRQVDNELNLSGGEMQKIAIARAMTKRARIIILDEPTNHLDKKSADFIRRYIAETTKTVLVVTHDPILLKVCNKRISL